VVATWLVADAVLGCVFAQLVSLKRAGRYSVPDSSGAPPPLLTLPFAIPGSPGRRLISRMSAGWYHWHDDVWPVSGRHGVTALFCASLALIVTTYLGRIMLAAASTGLLLATLMAILARRDGDALERWLTGLQITLAWSMGQLAMGSWSAVSFGLAMLAGLGTYARHRMHHEGHAAGAVLVRAVWVSMVLALLLARQPVPAMAVAVAALAERARAGQVPTSGRLGWLAAMMVAALAVNYWA
jgi:hypothetical protein